jgi:dolichol-phosphate mannosyltransferase
MSGISVIIPTYNERELIVDLLRTVLREVRQLAEVIVVDDDSPDGTGAAVAALAATDRRIRLMHRSSRRGLAGALAAGISAAQGDFICWIDADFFSAPGALDAIVSSCEGFDIAIASRYIEGGSDLRGRLRIVSSRVFNRCARVILGSRIHDLTSGQVVCRRSVFDSLKIEGCYGEYFIRFVVAAERKGMKIREVAFSALPRAGGSSKTTSSFFGFIGKGISYAFTVAQLRFS